MLLSAVSVLVVAQSSSEIPEGLMNNPVFILVFVSLVTAVVSSCCMYFRIIDRHVEHSLV